jgi:two-component system, OmpR family, response regulator
MATVDSRPMRFLVIEDDEETAASIISGLKARGHDAALAKDGREGFRFAVSERFDAIILDRMLPALDGLGVIALMRRRRVNASAFLDQPRRCRRSGRRPRGRRRRLPG